MYSLYEPCIVCKKQLAAYHKLHQIQNMSIAAVKKNKNEFVKDNYDLMEVLALKKTFALHDCRLFFF